MLLAASKAPRSAWLVDWGCLLAGQPASACMHPCIHAWRALSLCGHWRHPPMPARQPASPRDTQTRPEQQDKDDGAGTGGAAAGPGGERGATPPGQTSPQTFSSGHVVWISYPFTIQSLVTSLASCSRRHRPSSPPPCRAEKGQQLGLLTCAHVGMPAMYPVCRRAYMCHVREYSVRSTDTHAHAHTHRVRL